MTARRPGLTREGLAALRNATQVRFETRPYPAGPAHQITALLDVPVRRETNTWLLTQRTHTLGVGGHVRSPALTGPTPPLVEAVALIPHAQRHPYWRTVMQTLRVGDHLALHWSGPQDDADLLTARQGSLALHVGRTGAPPRAWSSLDFLLLTPQCAESATLRILPAPHPPYIPPRPASTDDQDALRELCAELLATTRRQRARLHLAPALADALPSRELTVGPVVCAVVRDPLRAADEALLVVGAGRRSTFLGRGYLPPRAVRDTGATAVAMYRRLRTAGTSPVDASTVAVGAGRTAPSTTN